MRALLLGLALVAGACGDDGPAVGPSGLDRGLTSGELTEAQRRQLCEFIVDSFGGPGELVDCGDGVSLETPSVDDCLASSRSFDPCSITVGVIEDCQDSMAGDICVAFNTPACDPLRACLGM